MTAFSSIRCATASSIFRDEYGRFPSVAEESGNSYFANGRFDGMDALVTYVWCVTSSHTPCWR